MILAIGIALIIFGAILLFDSIDFDWYLFTIVGAAMIFVGAFMVDYGLASLSLCASILT